MSRTPPLVMGRIEGKAPVTGMLPAILTVVDMGTHEVIHANGLAEAWFGRITGKKCWRVLQRNQRGPCADCNFQDLLDENDQPAGAFRRKSLNSVTGRFYELTEMAMITENGRYVKFSIALDVTEKTAAKNRAAMRAEFVSAHGIVTVCQNCHKLRDRFNNWRSPMPCIETFFDAAVSSGICPDCATLHYPEFDLYGPKGGEE